MCTWEEECYWWRRKTDPHTAWIYITFGIYHYCLCLFFYQMIWFCVHLWRISYLVRTVNIALERFVFSPLWHLNIYQYMYTLKCIKCQIACQYPILKVAELPVWAKYHKPYWVYLFTKYGPDLGSACVFAVNISLIPSLVPLDFSDVYKAWPV